MEGETSAGCRRINRLCDRSKAATLSVNLVDRVDQLRKRPRHSVELPNNESVAGFQEVDGFCKPRPVLVCAGCRLFEYFATTSLLQRIDLQIHVLVARRNPGV